MIFSVARIVLTMSKVMTLEPGDLIPTGTTVGVGLGRKPPARLKAGNEITIEVDGVGLLVNKVIADSCSASGI